MSAQHTPGPCTACGADPIPRDCLVCGPWMVKSWPGADGRIRYYAARTTGKIAVLDWMKGEEGNVIRFDSLRQARAAIAKATGAAS